MYNITAKMVNLVGEKTCVNVSLSWCLVLSQLLSCHVSFCLVLFCFVEFCFVSYSHFYTYTGVYNITAKSVNLVEEKTCFNDASLSWCHFLNLES